MSSFHYKINANIELNNIDLMAYSNFKSFLTHLGITLLTKPLFALSTLLSSLYLTKDVSKALLTIVLNNLNPHRKLYHLNHSLPWSNTYSRSIIMFESSSILLVTWCIVAIWVNLRSFKALPIELFRHSQEVLHSEYYRGVQSEGIFSWWLNPHESRTWPG